MNILNFSQSPNSKGTQKNKLNRVYWHTFMEIEFGLKGLRVT